MTGNLATPGASLCTTGSDENGGDGMKLKASRRIGGVALGLLLAGGAVGCTTVQRADSAGGAVTTTPAAATATVTETETETAAATATKAGSASGTKTTTTTAKKATTTTTTNAGSGAKVVSLTVVKAPSCPVVAKPGAPFSSPGNGVTIAWKITGAEGAAVSIDTPGGYGTYGSDYPAAGQLELSFPCETTPGKTTHTYTVSAKGMKSVFKNLSVSATNNAP